jgi:hypothetical protein
LPLRGSEGKTHDDGDADECGNDDHVREGAGRRDD